jgi:hypothetical protein
MDGTLFFLNKRFDEGFPIAHFSHPLLPHKILLFFFKYSINFMSNPNICPIKGFLHKQRMICFTGSLLIGM